MEFTPEQVNAFMAELRASDVTKKIHKELYPALSPSRPELSQAGRTVLITGGGTSVGFSIALAFTQASAERVIIIGRRLELLESAKARLIDAAKAAGSPTDVEARACDMTDSAQVDELWGSLAARGVVVDVFVPSAAKFPPPKPILELGADEVWSAMETNAKAPLVLAEKFYKQLGGKKGFIVHVATQAIHLMAHEGVAVRPAYTLTKMTPTLIFQLIAQNSPVEKLQVASFHPGLVYSEEWKTMGLGPEWFDQDALCGAFAVWLATERASFLHGRFVHAAWDVEELSDPNSPARKRMEDDPYFLRGSIAGLKGMFMA